MGKPLLRLYRFISEVFNAFQLLQFLLKLGGGGVITAWLGNNWQSLISLPVEVRIPALIAIFALAFFLVGAVIKVVKTGKTAVDNRIVKKIRKDKIINGILATVGDIDNRFYELMPEAEKQPLTEQIAHDLFNLRTASFIFISLFNTDLALGLISTLVERNGIGIIKQANNDDEFHNLDCQLDKQLRLKPIAFRNYVYNHINYWRTAANNIMFFHRYVEVNKGHPPLIAQYALNRLDNMRRQGIGNWIVSLAIKLGSV